MDGESFVHAMRYVAAAVAMLSTVGASLGVGLAAFSGLQAMGRNPDAGPMIQTSMILGIVFAEAIAIYALAVALIVVFV